MEKTAKQFCPISGNLQSTPRVWWQVTRGGDIVGQDWQGRMGSGATVPLQQEYGTLASTSHTNTEPPALGTDSDLFLKLAN